MMFKDVKRLLLGGVFVVTAGLLAGCPSNRVTTPVVPPPVDPTNISAAELEAQELLAVEHPVDVEIWTRLAEYYLGSRNCRSAVKTGYYALTLEKENPRAQKVVDICLAEREAKEAYQAQRDAAIADAKRAKEREQARQLAAMRQQQKEREARENRARSSKKSSSNNSGGSGNTASTPVTNSTISNKPVAPATAPKQPTAGSNDPFKLLRN